VTVSENLGPEKSAHLFLVNIELPAFPAVFCFPNPTASHGTGVFTNYFTIKINHPCRKFYTSPMDGMGMFFWGKEPKQNEA